MKSYGSSCSINMLLIEQTIHIVHEILTLGYTSKVLCRPNKIKSNKQSKIQTAPNTWEGFRTLVMGHSSRGYDRTISPHLVQQQVWPQLGFG